MEAEAAANSSLFDRHSVAEDEAYEEEDGCSSMSSDSSSSDALGWPLCTRERCSSFASSKSISSVNTIWEDKSKEGTFAWEEKREKRETRTSEVELMKEKFAKLLLGEDMSGGSKGVCTALTISNAITNLSASVFGQLWRLEPLPAERKQLWRREMEWLLSVSDYIVELVPSFSDGTSVEIMVTRPRSDIHINLPALRKLDTMLLESLDGYKETEFWYADQGITLSEPAKDGAAMATRKHFGLKRQEEKWWLPTLRVPPAGLSEQARRFLQSQRDCTSQILKAAMAINSQVLSEMEVPDLFWETLPKNGKACLGETLHRGLAAENFSPGQLLQQLDLPTEHNVLEIANKLEAAIHIWRRKLQQQQQQQQQKAHQHQQQQQPQASSIKHQKSSWGKVVKDHIVMEVDRVTLLNRVETLLVCLKQQFPGLSQTALDVSKIQYNRDVGQSILESYSRVLESLAFNILARIDDVMFINDATMKEQQQKQQQQQDEAPNVSAVVQHSPSSATARRTQKRNTPYATPNCSPERARCNPDLSHVSENSSPACMDKVAAAAAAAGFSHARSLETSRKLLSPPGRD